jgi:hypothetical protein
VSDRIAAPAYICAMVTSESGAAIRLFEALLERIDAAAGDHRPAANLRASYARYCSASARRSAVT